MAEILRSGGVLPVIPFSADETEISNERRFRAQMADYLRGLSSVVEGVQQEIARVESLIGGGGGGGVTDGDKGDVIVASAGTVWTVDSNAVTNTKLADMAGGTIKGRGVGAAGDPVDLTATMVRAIINVADGANAYVHPNHTGDVTSTGDGATVIANDVVSLSKMANVAQDTVFYRKTAGTGDPEVQPIATLKADLGLTGTNSGDQTITLTGDVTGAGTGSFAATVAANAVTNAKLADMAASTIKGNNTGGAADPLDLTATQVRTLLNVADGANAYVHPNHTGDVTSTGDGATAIAANAVTNAKLADMATATIKGRATAATGDPEDLTATQVRTLLNVADGAQVNVPTDLAYTAASRLLASSTGADATLPLVTSTDAGLAPASGGGAVNFLRADGAWAAPPAGSDVPFAYGQLTANYTLTSTTTTQKLFNWSANGALTLATGRYRFNCRIYLLSMSATTGNGRFYLKGAGTATVANIMYDVNGYDNSSPMTVGGRSGTFSVTEDSPVNMVTITSGSGLTAVIDGIFNVTVTGTIIPSIGLTTAAAAIVQSGSYFECIRIGDTGVNTLGSWT